jgi:chemotaxis signal transduction protein
MRNAPRASLGGKRAGKPAAAASCPVILFTAGDARFAVDAGAVKGIRDRDESASTQHADDEGLIDFSDCIGLGKGQLEHCVVLKPGDCSLGVTDVERITTLPRVVALPGLFRGAERAWYRGLILLDGEVIPLLRTEHWRQEVREKGRSGDGAA